MINRASDVDKLIVTSESLLVIKLTRDDLIASTINGSGTLRI